MRPGTSRMLCCSLLAAAACRPMAAEMARDGRVQRFEPSPVFADGGSARHLPRGAIARVAAHDAAVPPFAPSVDLAAAPPPDEPLSREALRTLLARGQDRYGVHCSPCHGATGSGDGAIVQRGYPRPPDFAESRLREAEDAHLYRVLVQGLGKMPPYGPHVAPEDRRAIVAWIRLLQRSQHASLDDAPVDERRRLERMRDDAREEPR